MFSKRVTDSDMFIEMPSATQALYFHLNQSADDDGFNNQVQVAMMKAHAGADDLKILLAKRFIIRFESGVIVIKHWRMHNTLRKDRYTPTAFKEEFAMLGIKENQSYTLIPENNGCHVVTNLVPQVSIGKDSIGNDSINNTLCRDDSAETKKQIEEVIAYLNDKSHSRYSAKTAETQKLMSGRFSDGYTVEDMEHVIDLKCDQWLKDAKMRQYLRPSTLFIPSKFESYLNEYYHIHEDQPKDPAPVISKMANSPTIAMPDD